MKTQLKIIIFLVLSNAIMLLLFGGSVYYFLYNYSYADFYKRLETRASITAKYNFESNNLTAESYKRIKEEHLEKLTEEKEYIYKISSESALFSIAEKSGLPIRFLKEIYTKGKSNLQLDDTFYSGIKYEINNELHIVLVSAQNYYASHHLLFIRNIIAIGILFILFVSTYLFIYFSKHIFDPINQITKKVKEISSESIHLRLDENTNDNEIGNLIATFNDLLNRLETAFESQKNFISSASHEYGTPLTSIMGEAEVMLRKERTSIEYQHSLKSILEQADRINQITQSLLFLAQTGYTKEKLNFEILRTDELIWQAKEIVDKLNPKNDIQIDFSLLPENPKKLKVSGNRQLLSLALVNIMTNACKYSNNKTVFVSLASTDSQVIIVIKDNGIGIPKQEMDYIYDPFFRASNAKQFEGYGIGLPLSRNIIRIHNGEILVSSGVNTGTTVQLKIPLANI